MEGMTPSATFPHGIDTLFFFGVSFVVVTTSVAVVEAAVVAA